MSKQNRNYADKSDQNKSMTTLFLQNGFYMKDVTHCCKIYAVKCLIHIRFLSK